ncbi:MAG TPA: polysaccharide deacetylase, partial [Arthrobacter sp.]|nr:polysaccharide deacetylase [Arthrobacter sp.]
LAGIGHYSGAKHRLLEKDGFDFFFGIDASTPAWMQLTDDYLRQARINVDGLSMHAALQGKHHVLDRFFDVRKVIDPARKKYGK